MRLEFPHLLLPSLLLLSSSAERGASFVVSRSTVRLRTAWAGEELEREPEASAGVERLSAPAAQRNCDLGLAGERDLLRDSTDIMTAASPEPHGCASRASIAPQRRK